jgi:hypothetical protein
MQSVARFLINICHQTAEKILTLQQGLIRIFNLSPKSKDMGKISAGALSGPSGKIGNLIGSSWRGISYLKARPEHYKDANTLKQQAARMRIKLLVPFLKACLPFIRIGFLGYSSPQLTSYNAATSYNLKNGITGEFPGLELNYTSLLLSRGRLPGGENASVEILEPGKINFNWSSASKLTEASYKDTAMVLAYNPVKQYGIYQLQGFFRGDGGCQLTVPDSFRGDPMECYLGFVNMTGLAAEVSEKNISDSMYLGELTIL